MFSAQQLALSAQASNTYIEVRGNRYSLLQFILTVEISSLSHTLWVHAPHKELCLWNTLFCALVTNNCSRPHVLRAIETAAAHLPQEMNSQRRGLLQMEQLMVYKFIFWNHLKSLALNYNAVK